MKLQLPVAKHPGRKQRVFSLKSPNRCFVHVSHRIGFLLSGTTAGECLVTCTVKVGSLHTPQPNTFKLSFSHLKIPGIGHLGSPLYFKNVKCQNSRDFLSAFIYFYFTFPMGQKFTYTQFVFGSIALGQTFRVAFHKLPTISWVNFGPFLLTELV